MSTSDQPIPSSQTFLLQKGRYVFVDQLTEELAAGAIVPTLSAKAICIVEKNGLLHGQIDRINFSDLILKQSTYIDGNGKMIEAHKLYSWPRNLGSTTDWTTAKKEFLNEYILNFPIEVISLQESNGVTWKYITPEEFKHFHDDIPAGSDFKHFASHKNEYFFLRRPIDEPK